MNRRLLAKQFALGKSETSDEPGQEGKVYMTDAGAQASIGTALVVSADAAAIAQVRETLQQLAMSAQVCGEVSAALRLLARYKFEAVLVDLGLGESAIKVFEQVRISSANRTAVTFAVSTNKEEASLAFKSGSNFVLQRPLNPDSLNQAFKAAYGLIVREKRRYFRYPVVVPAVIQPHGASQLSGETVNVSEQGIALSLPVPLAVGVEGRVQFTLPDFSSPIAAGSRVCWSNQNGQAGLCFFSLAPGDQSELQHWLARRLEQQLPESVAERFRQSSGR
ncbi:MAG: PilZ domain-containing protein [Terriglobales bacterium]